MSLFDCVHPHSRHESVGAITCASGMTLPQQIVSQMIMHKLCETYLEGVRGNLGAEKGVGFADPSPSHPECTGDPVGPSLPRNARPPLELVAYTPEDNDWPSGEPLYEEAQVRK